MTTTRLRRTAAAAALLMAAGGAIAAPSTADAAPAAHSRDCPTKHTFFHAIPAKQRAGVRYRHDPKRAVRGLRCTSHWAVAIVTAVDNHGRPQYSYEVLEHRAGTRWQVAGRAKACAHHRVPPKLHQEVCESD